MINPWQVLGIHRGSTFEETKQAYRNAQRVAHPDAGGSAEQSAQVSEAYKLLTSLKALNQYTTLAMLHGKPCTACNGKGYTSKQRSLTARTTTACKSCCGSGIITRSK